MIWWRQQASITDGLLFYLHNTSSLAADVVSVKPLWIYEAIFTLVTAGNMSVYQHVLERERVSPSNDSFTHM